jgi:uncharacterized membrane protein YGL010W
MLYENIFHENSKNISFHCIFLSIYMVKLSYAMYFGQEGVGFHPEDV